MEIKLGWGGVLLLLLVILKLVGGIHWSWLWVMSPLWIALILNLVCSVLLWFFDDEDDLGVNR